jgi:hypothetical protein
MGNFDRPRESDLERPEQIQADSFDLKYDDENFVMSHLADKGMVMFVVDQDYRVYLQPKVMHRTIMGKYGLAADDVMLTGIVEYNPDLNTTKITIAHHNHSSEGIENSLKEKFDRDLVPLIRSHDAG